MSSLKDGFRYLLTFPVFLMAKSAFGSFLKFSLLFTVLACVLGLFLIPMKKEEALRDKRNQSFLQDQNTSYRNWLVQESVDYPEFQDSGLLRDFRKGPDGAKVQILEFFDFECGFCGLMHESLKSLLEDYPDEVALYHRNYPLDNSCNDAIEQKMHEKACGFAEYARCAGEQGRYWEAADEIFASAGDWSSLGMEESIDRLSASLGLDTTALRECLDSDRQLERIRHDIAIGNSWKIPGTPSIWINEKRLERPNPRSLREVVEKLLEKE